MLPLSAGIRARRFPVANLLLIVANFAVFLLYDLPHFNAAFQRSGLPRLVLPVHRGQRLPRAAFQFVDDFVPCHWPSSDPRDLRDGAAAD